MTNTIQLGLCDPPEPIYLYVGAGEHNGQPYLWYQYDIDAQQQYPVFRRGLTGYLGELRITTKEYKGKDNHKLDVVMRCDRLYIVRSGLETNFSKTLLLALEAVPDFKQPLTLAVVPGEETVVFSRIYDAVTGNRYKAEWNSDANWLDIVTRIQERLGQPVAKRQLEPAAPQTAPQASYAALYPQHNAIIKKIRLQTGHSPEQIVDWCRQYNVSCPTDLTPELCRQLAQALALSWGKSKFDSPELCENAYRGKVEMLVASGMHWGDAIATWINSITPEPAVRH